MDCTSTRISYQQTHYFTRIILDYLAGAETLQPFYAHPPSLQGIEAAIRERKKFETDRAVLVNELQGQYNGVDTSEKVKKNIESFLSQDTFAITTAHQPNIFTGPLYFLYKLLHVIKLAEYCKTSFPKHHFVPVFYMGSEDADLDELGHFHLNGEKISWETKQGGAVGRMLIDKDLLKLISGIEGQLAVLPFGTEILSIVKSCYREGVRIQDATFRLINALFAEYGLVVLIPDNEALKAKALKIFENDLLNETPAVIVEQTATRLQAAGYKLQAHPREINLFYLDEGMRERIVRKDTEYRIQNTTLRFSKEEMLKELQEHPGRFSPNVILRGIYQEIILPNLAYIGGGGEIAYWLQLKDLFEFFKIPYPVLLLRNSFLVIEKKWQDRIAKTGFSPVEFFLSTRELMDKLVARESSNEIKLNGNFTEAEKLYAALKQQAIVIDATLGRHVDALKSQSLYRLQELEKKMLRAEKRKFSDQQRQIEAIKERLFPKNNLQERIDNFMYYYATWGKDFITQIYKHSPGLEEEFVVLLEK